MSSDIEQTDHDADNENFDSYRTEEAPLVLTGYSDIFYRDPSSLGNGGYLEALEGWITQLKGLSEIVGNAAFASDYEPFYVSFAVRTSPEQKQQFGPTDPAIAKIYIKIFYHVQEGIKLEFSSAKALKEVEGLVIPINERLTRARLYGEEVVQVLAKCLNDNISNINLTKLIFLFKCWPCM